MKNLLIGLLAVTSISGFAQDLDPIAERARLNQKLETLELQGDGDLSDQQRVELDRQLDITWGKSEYISELIFEKYNYKRSDEIKFFNTVNNRSDAMVVKDSKGQILYYQSASDLLGKADEQQYELCNTDSQVSVDENDEVRYNPILASMGLDYKTVSDQYKNNICEILEGDLSTCNDFSSATRISMVETLEKKKSKLLKRIKKIGYHNATDEEFLALDNVDELRSDVADQVQNVEILCKNESVDLYESMNDHLYNEAKDGGLSIEYNIIKTSSAREE